MLSFIVSFMVSCSNRLPSNVETEASLATTEWLDQKYGMNPSPELRRLMMRIAGRLASAVHGTALDRESFRSLEGELIEYPWQVYVLKDREVNAFSVGSGIIFLTEGLLRKLSTEAELAAVVAHEMSHQLLGHTRQAIAEGAEHGTPEDAESPTIAYSLDHELDADTLSLKLLRVARYDVRHATSALAIGYRGGEANVSAVPPEWISARMANMEQKIDRMGEYLPATQTTREFSKVLRRLFG